MIERKPIVWFLVFSFLFSWTFFLIPLTLTSLDLQTRQLATIGLWSLGMFGPGLAALYTNRFILRQPITSLRLNTLGPKRFYLWAWFLPGLLSVTTAIFTILFGLAEFDPQFSFMREGLASAPGGTRIDPLLVIIAQSAFGILLAPYINALFALGEELGWRGFLLPKLVPLGQWKAIILSGVIWGVWHAPVIVQGHNYPGYPISGIFMMIVLTILLGTILAWLYFETRSPWAPALAHGAFNAAAGLPLLFLKPGFNLAFGGTLATFPGWLAMGIFIAWLVVTKRLPVKDMKRDGTAAQI
jgi:membrane protease YdiL (CAAX protease family)